MGRPNKADLSMYSSLAASLSLWWTGQLRRAWESIMRQTVQRLPLFFNLNAFLSWWSVISKNKSQTRSGTEVIPVGYLRRFGNETAEVPTVAMSTATNCYAFPDQLSLAILVRSNQFLTNCRSWALPAFGHLSVRVGCSMSLSAEQSADAALVIES